jgi:hypothetical protein
MGSVHQGSQPYEGRAGVKAWAIVLAVLLIGCVNGRQVIPPPPVTFDIAPEPYNSQGQGMLRTGAAWVDTVPDAEARSLCGGPMARAQPNAFMPCRITISADVPAWFLEAAVRHEAGHCAGWPGDHANSVQIVVGD